MLNYILTNALWQTIGVLITIIGVAIGVIRFIEKKPNFKKKTKLLYNFLTVFGAIFLIAGTAFFLRYEFSLSQTTAFTDIVKNQRVLNTDFFEKKWDSGNQKGGSCTPDFQTESLRIVTNPSKGMFSCMLRQDKFQGNMALQVTATIEEGAVIGLTFKDNNLDSPHHYYYLYTINISTGYYELSKGLGDRPSTIDNEQIPNTFSLGQNSTNTLEVVIQSQNICLYANQNLLHCIQDTSMYNTGNIGLYVGADPGSVTFSHLTVWQLIH